MLACLQQRWRLLGRQDLRRGVLRHRVRSGGGRKLRRRLCLLCDKGRTGVLPGGGVPLAPLRSALLFASLAMFAPPALAEPALATATDPEPPTWRLAGGMGTAYVAEVDCGGCPHFHGGGIAFTVEAGARLRPTLGLVGRFTLATVPFADHTSAHLLDLGPGLLWWVSDRLWISATVGWGMLSMDEDRPQSMATLWSANGLSAGAGVAADVVRLGTTMSLYVELRALALVTSRFTTTNGSLVLGFRWH